MNIHRQKLLLVIFVLVYLLFMNSCVSSEFMNEMMETAQQSSNISTTSFSKVQVTGTYRSDFGDLILKQSGDYVLGEYPSGTIEGTISGNVLAGVWTQAYSSGLFRFEFTADGTGFSGLWGTGNDDPTAQWNGTRIGAAAASQPQPQKPAVQQPSVSENLQIAGTYDSDYEEMLLNQSGDYVWGEYRNGNGTIEGIISGNIMTGTWTEGETSGRIRFEFAADGTGFSGLWGYGNDDPAADWNGTRIGTAAAAQPQPQKPAVQQPSVSENLQIAGTYDSDYDEMLLNQSGDSVWGDYPTGTIEGTISGNILTGIWTEAYSNGSFRFEFTADGNSFSGLWSYGNDEPIAKWDGNR